MRRPAAPRPSAPSLAVPRTTPAETIPPDSPRSDPDADRLAVAISDAVQDHRGQLGLAARAYAVRRAWTIGFLDRVITDPLALLLGDVVSALEGTGYALVVARLPTEPMPCAGSAASAQQRGAERQPKSQLFAPPVLAPVIRLPTWVGLGDVGAEVRTTQRA